MSLLLVLHPTMTFYGSLVAPAIHCFHLLVGPNWNTNQYAVYSLDIQPIIRDIVALNHIQAASILADMSDLMSSIFHSRMLQPLIPLVVNFFNYKHFPHLFRILLYNTHLLVPSLLEWLL
jgi:hypothetical protein